MWEAQGEVRGCTADSPQVGAPKQYILIFSSSFSLELTAAYYFMASPGLQGGMEKQIAEVKAEFLTHRER